MGRMCYVVNAGVRHATPESAPTTACASRILVGCRCAGVAGAVARGDEVVYLCEVAVGQALTFSAAGAEAASAAARDLPKAPDFDSWLRNRVTPAHRVTAAMTAISASST